MLQRRTIIISLSIVGSALLFAGFLMVHANPALENKELSANINETVRPLSESLQILPKNTEPNATEAIAKQIAQELIAKNPNGPSLLDGKSAIESIDPETLLNDVLAEELARFNPEDLQPIISVEELNLLNDNSKVALETYFKGLRNILAQSKIDSTITSFNAQEFLAFSKNLQEITDALYSLPVPVMLAPFHADELSLIEAQKNIFKRAAYASEDPLSAYLAIQMLPSINEEFLKISTAYSEIIEKNNLQI